jgi:hypothetical protein
MLLQSSGPAMRTYYFIVQVLSIHKLVCIHCGARKFSLSLLSGHPSSSSSNNLLRHFPLFCTTSWNAFLDTQWGVVNQPNTKSGDLIGFSGSVDTADKTPMGVN